MLLISTKICKVFLKNEKEEKRKEKKQRKRVCLIGSKLDCSKFDGDAVFRNMEPVLLGYEIN